MLHTPTPTPSHTVHTLISTPHIHIYLLVALLTLVGVVPLQQVPLHKGLQGLKEVTLASNVYIQSSEWLSTSIPGGGTTEKYTNNLFTLGGGTVLEQFQNRSYCSVNGCGTVLKQTIPGGTVPPRVDGPNWSRTVLFASENDTARKQLFTPLVLRVTG